MTDKIITRHLLNPDDIEPVLCGENDPISPCSVVVRRDVGYPYDALVLTKINGVAELICRLQKTASKIGRPVSMTIYMQEDDAPTILPIFIENNLVYIGISTMGGIGFTGNSDYFGDFGVAFNAKISDFEYIHFKPQNTQIGQHLVSLDYTKNGIDAPTFAYDLNDYTGTESNVTLLEKISNTEANQVLKQNINGNNSDILISQNYKLDSANILTITIDLFNTSTDEITNIFFAHAMVHAFNNFLGVINYVNEREFISFSLNELDNIAPQPAVGVFTPELQILSKITGVNISEKSARNMWSQPTLNAGINYQGFLIPMIFNIPSLSPGEKQTLVMEMRHGFTRNNVTVQGSF